MRLVLPILLSIIACSRAHDGSNVRDLVTDLSSDAKLYYYYVDGPRLVRKECDPGELTPSRVRCAIPKGEANLAAFDQLLGLGQGDRLAELEGEVTRHYDGLYAIDSNMQSLSSGGNAESVAAKRGEIEVAGENLTRLRHAADQLAAAIASLRQQIGAGSTADLVNELIERERELLANKRELDQSKEALRVLRTELVELSSDVANQSVYDQLEIRYAERAARLAEARKDYDAELQIIIDLNLTRKLLRSEGLAIEVLEGSSSFASLKPHLRRFENAFLASGLNNSNISVSGVNNAIIAAGRFHTCALTTAGVRCWGSNVWSLTEVPTLVQPVSIAAGYKHTCALTAAGVKCWGSIEFGATTVPALDRPTAIAVGESRTCALTAAGVVCWGRNTSPGPVPDLDQPTAIAAGDSHACALTAAGVKCWGDNEYGQTTVPALEHPTAIAAGAVHTCALTAAGVKCWGRNNSGQITVPVLEQPSAIAAGARQTCALTAAGVICWGEDNFDQTTVPALEHPTAVGVGEFHTCAMTATGVKCWGCNDEGQTTVPTL